VLDQKVIDPDVVYWPVFVMSDAVPCRKLDPVPWISSPPPLAPAAALELVVTTMVHRVVT
jgi:hypothetical protein